MASKNIRFFEKFIAEFREDENEIENVYVGRVLRKFGNGRVEVFFMDKNNRPAAEQAVIRGVFRGRGKHGAWVDINSIVIITDTGVASARYVIVSVLNPDQIKTIKKEMSLDARVFAMDNTDKESLLNRKIDDDCGITFDGDDEPEEEITKYDGNKKNKPTKHSKLLAKEELDEGDIDAI